MALAAIIPKLKHHKSVTGKVLGAEASGGDYDFQDHAVDRGGSACRYRHTYHRRDRGGLSR